MIEEKKELLEMSDDPLLVIEEDPEFQGALRVHVSKRIDPLMLADILEAFVADLRSKFKETPSAMHVIKPQGDA